MRLLHLSDIHVWHWPTRFRDLWSKRALGVGSLVVGRAARFPQGRLHPLTEYVASLQADHLLITGDFTTTALPSEFETIRNALEPALKSVRSVSLVPGNHDRYTSQAVRQKLFERTFGAYLPRIQFPWIHQLDKDTIVLGLDPCRAHATATGFLPEAQLQEARLLLNTQSARYLIIACHYPLEAPLGLESHLKRKRLTNGVHLADLLRKVGPHLYCCGHLHHAWAFRSSHIPGQLSLNPGAPLIKTRSRTEKPGFLEIELSNSAVKIDHHGWDGTRWCVEPMFHDQEFFPKNILSKTEPIA